MTRQPGLVTKFSVWHKRRPAGSVFGAFRFLRPIIMVAVLSAVLSLPACARPPQAQLEASVTGGAAPLTVHFTNTSQNADQFQWDFGDGATMTTSKIEEPAAHEYTRAGTYTVTLKAVKTRGREEASTATVTIDVKHGPPEHVKLNPEKVTLNIGQVQGFATEVVDAYDNPVPEIMLTWSVAEGAGTITREGILTAGTKAGTFDEGVAVTATLDTYSVRTASSVTVLPGPLASVRIAPVQVGAGETQQLEVIPTDQYGNRVSGIDKAWTLSNADAGSVTRAGVFTAGEIVGSYAEAVKVEVTQGELVRTGSAGITITPGPLEQVIIAPDPAEIGMGMTQKFVAVAADQYGNRISGLTFKWSVENDGGTIDESGLFTAGTVPGTYKDTVKAEATKGGVTRSATADVTVEPDRIAFISDRNDDQFDIYVMDVDGTNIERLTTTDAWEHTCSWSPDGRRIVYDSWDIGDGILVMNDDGSWKFLLIENSAEAACLYPAWSADGTRIAFIKTSLLAGTIYDLDISVMDVDGGNVTQLTDTPEGDEWVPTWSPDSAKIVYDYTLSGERGDIYVMDADGSNRQRLTSHLANDTAPVWSPDGTRIAFMSNRDGDYEIFIMNADGTDVRQLTSNDSIYDVEPSWSPDGSKIVFTSDRDTPGKGQIYIMDADGSNVTRITSNENEDSYPCWSPRKKGVEVTGASVIVPDTSTASPLATEKVTAQARKAVVRIKTELGSGSGFIIKPDGLVLTNNHVIRDAKEITVYLEDGTSYAGTIKARDMVRDLALLKIEATGLTYLELGDLSEVGLGQQVIVLGYPLGGVNVTVTSGLVSAIEFDGGRNITWVQTDSAINPGNSGGPMMNLQGKVIGVVSAKMVGLAVEGIGFAISANTVNIYLPRLEDGQTIASF